MKVVEIWRTLPREPLYEISSFGRVRCWRSGTKFRVRGTKAEYPKVGYFAPPGLPNAGSYCVVLRNELISMQRLMIEAFYGVGTEAWPVPKNSRLDRYIWDISYRLLDGPVVSKDQMSELLGMDVDTIRWCGANKVDPTVKLELIYDPPLEASQPKKRKKAGAK